MALGVTMPLRDRLILAADVQITPADTLSSRLQRRLGARPGDAAITRLRGRAPAKLIDQHSAILLESFRESRTVANAVQHCALQLKLDPAALLKEAFPLLRDCYNSRFLVTADSDDAAPTLPSRGRGDPIGRYRVLRCLQVLEDTELYQVRDLGGKLAALKLARPGNAALGLFRREAAALEHLGGSGAPKLLATGSYHGRPWLAMSWSEGVPPELACREIRDVGDRRSVLTILESVARAYASLHRQGVIHGDVHPGNILIGKDGSVTLIDFGLARPIAPLRLAGKASHGAVLQHIAPEQAEIAIRGEDLACATLASEQYAVAVLLYRLATGRIPLDLSLDRTTAMQQIREGKVLPFVKHGLIPWPELESVLRRGLSGAPEARFKSMAEMAEALRALGRRNVRRGTTGQAGVKPELLEATVAAFLGRVAIDAPAIRQQGRAPHCSLMLGRSGTAYALYRIALIRNDPAILALADAWLSQVERDADDALAFESPDDGLEREGLGLASPYHTRTGVSTTRALVALAMGNRSEAADAIAAFVNDAGTRWPRRDLTLGRMGVPLAAAMLIEALPESMATSHVALERLGRSVVAEVWRELDILGPMGSPGQEEDFGTAHGWAGIIAASMRWAAATGDPLPGGLPERLAELVDGAEPLGRGVHWAQRVTGSAPSLLATHQVAGWCNGPAGFVPMLAMAAARYSGEHFDSLAEATAWSSWEAPSEVFDLCCGLTGRSYALVCYYRMSGDTTWLRRAEQLASRAIEQFRTVRPGLPRPLSLFKGEAGVALLAADLLDPDRATSPFFEPEGFPARLRDGRSA